MTRAFFLDRDGVINADKAYVHKIADFEFVDGIFDACRAAQSRGFIIIVATNQSGIARGYYSEEDFAKLTAHMLGEFEKRGVRIADVFHCPLLDGPDRKPNPGMFLKARDRHSIDMSRSVSLGDKERDIEAASRAGVVRNYLLSESAGKTAAYAVVKSPKEMETLSAFDF